MGEDERRERARLRRARALIVRTRLGDDDTDLVTVSGPEAISLVTRLTIESWSLSGMPWPTYRRSEGGVRVGQARGPCHQDRRAAEE